MSKAKLSVRSKRSVVAEYNRVSAEVTRRIRKARLSDAAETYRVGFLQGANQALAWALRDLAQAPSKCVAPIKKRRKKEPRNG